MAKLACRIFLIALIASSPGRATGTASNDSDSIAMFLAKNGFQGVRLNRRYPNWLSVPVRINQRPGALIVATACPISGIDRDSARRFALSERRTNMRVRGSLGLSDERYGLSDVRTLSVGNSNFSDVRVAVLNAKNLNADRRQLHVDGLLGYAEMRKLGAVLDCGRRALYLNSRGPSREMSANLEQFLSEKGFTRVPMTMNSRHHPEVPCAINGRAVTMTVDTAAVFTCIKQQTAAKAGISSKPSTLAAGAAGGRKARMNIGKAKTLSIGNFKLMNVNLAIVAAVIDSLGIEHLSFNSAVLDMGGMNLYLRSADKR